MVLVAASLTRKWSNEIYRNCERVGDIRKVCYKCTKRILSGCYNVRYLSGFYTLVVRSTASSVEWERIWYNSTPNT